MSLFEILALTLIGFIAIGVYSGFTSIERRLDKIAEEWRVRSDR